MRGWFLLVPLLFAGSALAQEPPPGFQPLWNGRDLSGWEFLNCTEKDWLIQDGTLSTLKGGTRHSAFLMTEGQYDDFELRLEFLVTKGADSGLAIRSAPTGAPHANGIEIQLIDDAAYPRLKLQETTGALWGIAAPANNAAKPAGEWNQLHLTVNERKLKVMINDIAVQDVDLDELKKAAPRHQGLQREAGHIGLQTRIGVAKLRNVFIKPLSETPPPGKVTLALDPGGHTARIGKVFFSHDGKSLVTGSADHSVRVWDVATGEQRRVLRPPGIGNLSIMALSPTEDKVAVACQYPEGKKLHHVIYLLRLKDGQVERVLKGHKDLIIALAFSADGKRLASSAEDASIRIWDSATGNVEQVLETKIGWRGIEGARGKGLGELALSPTGDRLAYIATGRDAFVIEVATGKSLAKLPMPPEGLDCNGVAWSPDGKIIATTGRGRTAAARGVYFWNVDGTLRPQPEGPLLAHGVSFSKDSGRVLLAWHGNPYHRATLLDLETGKTVVTFAPTKSLVPGYGPPASVADCALSPDGKLAATVGGGQGLHEVFIWQTADATLVHRMAAPSWLRPEIAWSQDGKSVAWGNPKGKTRPRFHLGEFQLGTTTSPGELRGPSLEEGALTLDSRSTGARYWERKVVKEGDVIARLGVPHRAHVPWGATFVGPQRVSLSGDWGGFFLYDVATQKRIREFKTAEGRIAGTAVITSIAPSPDKARFLATSGIDQMLRIWDPERERPLLTLYVHGEDWIIWTEEGYYAATPGGERLMGWTVDNGIDKSMSFYPAERFRKQFRRPEVIKLVLKKGSVAAALKTANAAEKIETRNVKVEDLLPPRVMLKVDESKKPIYKLKVQAEASTKDQPITSLRLRINNKIVPGTETFAEFPGGKVKAEVEWTIELPAGEHRLNVMARSPDSTGFSPAISVKFRNLAKLPTLHVMTVGINKYKDGTLDLKYAEPDAKELPKAFIKHCKGLAFRNVVPCTLVNKDATKENILKKLADMRKEIQQQDLVVVFFACHGVKDKKGYYLLTHEANVNDLAGTTLRGEKLRQELAEFKCQVLLMLDACHAAGFGAGKKLAKLGLKPATDDATRDLTDDDVGVAVMCAAMAHEKAEGVGGYGLFTKAVLEALAGGPKVPVNPFNQRLYVHHMQSYVFDHVSHHSEQRQHPFLSLPWLVESFPVR